MQSNYLDPFIETLGRDALQQIQLKKFQIMLGSLLKTNAFYRRKLLAAGIKNPEDFRSLENLHLLPFTTKAELSADQTSHPPYGTN